MLRDRQRELRAQPSLRAASAAAFFFSAACWALRSMRSCVRLARSAKSSAPAVRLRRAGSPACCWRRTVSPACASGAVAVVSLSPLKPCPRTAAAMPATPITHGRGHGDGQQRGALGGRTAAGTAPAARGRTPDAGAGVASSWSSRSGAGAGARRAARPVGVQLGRRPAVAAGRTGPDRPAARSRRRARLCRPAFVALGVPLRGVVRPVSKAWVPHSHCWVRSAGALTGRAGARRSRPTARWRRAPVACGGMAAERLVPAGAQAVVSYAPVS